MVSRQQVRWPMFRRVWRRAELLESMADILDADLSIGARIDGGEAFRKATENCLRCPFTGDCRNWIEASSDLPLPPEFCSNADFFDQCIAGRDKPDTD